ncbi:tryptophan-rich sensory protein [Candidatus Pacearchaeota archaeon]|nr:tryptophan-rich sensory protein [Candidatus Pacearchaeota archaeon]
MKRSKNKSKFFKKSKFNLKVFISCFIIVVAVAFFGSRFTKIDSWYESVKPAITPPNYIFPIAWTILFALIALSLYFAWINSDKKWKPDIIILFGFNFAFNILWSFFYFTIHSPVFALIDLIFLLFSIIVLIIFIYRIDKKASYLLMPYLLWVCFAGILNYLTISNIK